MHENKYKDYKDETLVKVILSYKAKGRDHFQWETNVGEQKANNIHMNVSVSRDEFIKMRTERDKTLGAPKLILPSVQVNMHASEFYPHC